MRNGLTLPVDAAGFLGNGAVGNWGLALTGWENVKGNQVLPASPPLVEENRFIVHRGPQQGGFADGLPALDAVGKSLAAWFELDGSQACCV